MEQFLVEGEGAKSWVLWSVCAFVEVCKACGFFLTDLRKRICKYQRTPVWNNEDAIISPVPLRRRNMSCKGWGSIIYSKCSSSIFTAALCRIDSLAGAGQYTPQTSSYGRILLVCLYLATQGRLICTMAEELPSTQIFFMWVKKKSIFYISYHSLQVESLIELFKFNLNFM
jgi:hypothetical protein